MKRIKFFKNNKRLKKKMEEYEQWKGDEKKSLKNNPIYSCVYRDSLFQFEYENTASTHCKE